MVSECQPNKKISIAYFGVGIPSTVRNIQPFISESEAIKLAFQDGFSSKSSPANRGVGLYLLLQNVVQRFRGTVSAYSMSANVIYFFRNGEMACVENTGASFCPGTLFDLTFPTDFIPHRGEDSVGDFEW